MQSQCVITLSVSLWPCPPERSKIEHSDRITASDSITAIGLILQYKLLTYTGVTDGKDFPAQ